MRDLTKNEIKVYDILIELDRGGGVYIKDIVKKSGFSTKEIIKITDQLKQFGEVYEPAPFLYKVLR